jgi:hypothetical protein
LRPDLDAAVDRVLERLDLGADHVAPSFH